jgi:hypothetical protein
MANDTVETRLRRMASRRGLALVKSRRRDPGAIGFGMFHLRELGSERVIGVLPGGGLRLVQANASEGGALRFAAWFSLANAERILTSGVP